MANPLGLAARRIVFLMIGSLLVMNAIKAYLPELTPEISLIVGFILLVIGVKK